MAKQTTSENLPDVKKQNAVMASGVDLASWGQQDISAEDIIIPRILLMQPMSEKVTQGDAAFGDFISSLDNSKIGTLKEGFNIIPICMDKVWVEYDVTQGDDFKNKKFLRVVKITPDNDGLPYKDSEGPVKISRDKLMNFYVLLEKEMALGGALPHVLTFRRTGLNAGKALITQMMIKNRAAGKAPPAVTCVVNAEKTTNEAGTWVVPTVRPLKETDPRHIEEAYKWFGMIQKGKAKVDEKALAEEDIKSSNVSVETGPERF